MAWKIDRDYIPMEGCERVGLGQYRGGLIGKTYRFRLCDNDGNLVYGGMCDGQAAELACMDDESYGSLLTAWQYGMADAGATECELHVCDAIELGLWSASLQDSTGQKDNDWVSVFG